MKTKKIKPKIPFKEATIKLKKAMKGCGHVTIDPSFIKEIFSFCRDKKGNITIGVRQQEVRKYTFEELFDLLISQLSNEELFDLLISQLSKFIL